MKTSNKIILSSIIIGSTLATSGCDCFKDAIQDQTQTLMYGPVAEIEEITNSDIFLVEDNFNI